MVEHGYSKEFLVFGACVGYRALDTEMNFPKKSPKNQIFFEDTSKSIVECAKSGVFYNLPTTSEVGIFLTAADYLIRRETSPRVKARPENFEPEGVVFDYKGANLIEVTWQSEKHEVKILFRRLDLAYLATFHYFDSNNTPRASIMKLLTLFLANTSKLNKSKSGQVSFTLADVPFGVLDKGRRQSRKFIEAVGTLLTNTELVVKKRGEKGGRVYRGKLLNGFEYAKRKITLTVEKGNSLFAHSVKYLVPFPREIFQAGLVEFNLLLKVLNRARQGSLKISIPLLLDAAGYTKDEARQSRWRVRKIFEADLTLALDRLGWSVFFDGDWALIKTDPRVVDVPKKPRRRVVEDAPDFMVGDLEKFDMVNAQNFIISQCDFITESDPSKIPKRPPPKRYQRFLLRALGVILGNDRGKF